MGNNGENVTKRLANLETRYAELAVKISGLADMQDIQHQRLLRLETAVRDLHAKPLTKWVNRWFPRVS